MGMSINDHIEVLKSYNHGFTAQAGNLQDSIDVALDIMRKYQKIVQIMERTVDDGTSMYDTLQEIEEVVEDGKID